MVWAPAQEDIADTSDTSERNVHHRGMFTFLKRCPNAANLCPARADPTAQYGGEPTLTDLATVSVNQSRGLGRKQTSLAKMYRL